MVSEPDGASSSSGALRPGSMGPASRDSNLWPKRVLHLGLTWRTKAGLLARTRLYFSSPGWSSTLPTNISSVLAAVTNSSKELLALTLLRACASPAASWPPVLALLVLLPAPPLPLPSSRSCWVIADRRPVGLAPRISATRWRLRYRWKVGKAWMLASCARPWFCAVACTGYHGRCQEQQHSRQQSTEARHSAPLQVSTQQPPAPATSATQHPPGPPHLTSHPKQCIQTHFHVAPTCDMPQSCMPMRRKPVGSPSLA